MAFVSFTAVPGMFAGPERRARRRAATCVDRATYDMLQLYRTNLEVRLQGVDEEGLSNHQRQIYATVAEKLQTRVPASGAEWDEIYTLERLMALLFSGAQLRQELTRRLDELADEKVPEAERFRREYEGLSKPTRQGQPSAADDGVLRALLLRVVETLQATARRRSLAKPIRKEAIKKLLFGVLFGFGLLVAPYAWLSIDFPGPEAPLVSRWWSHFPLYSALVAGGVGAFFSRLMQLHRDWAKMPLEEVCSHSEASYVGLRAAVGMCGALILYYFFQAGLIDGAVFPQVKKFAIELVEVAPPAVHMAFTVPSKDLALLIVWCFLGGFSEALVPGLLAKTEGQISSGGAAAKG